MQKYDNIRTDTWIISIPTDWVEMPQPKEGGLHLESADGEKSIFIATWNIGKDRGESPKSVAESFIQTELSSFDNMDGYSWRIVENQSIHKEIFSIALFDSYAEAKDYRIAGKILSRPPTVVQASFHDYVCTDYDASREYFAPIIESLQFSDRTQKPDEKSTIRRIANFFKGKNS